MAKVDKTLRKIEQTIGILVETADDAGVGSVAYFLRMAALQAHDVLDGSQPPNFISPPSVSRNAFREAERMAIETAYARLGRSV